MDRELVEKIAWEIAAEQVVPAMVKDEKPGGRQLLAVALMEAGLKDMFQIPTFSQELVTKLTDDLRAWYARGVMRAIERYESRRGYQHPKTLADALSGPEYQQPRTLTPVAPVPEYKP